MRRLPLIRHRTANRVRAAYRACRDGVEKTRWHAIWLLLRTEPAQIAELSVITTRDVLKRWNRQGPEGPTDARKNNGSEPKLDSGRRAELLGALIRESLANRSVGRIDWLKAIVRDRVSYLTGHPDEVQPRVGFRGAVGLER